MNLIESLATTEPLAGVFSDAHVLEAMLKVEAGLARAAAGAGAIPGDAAAAIASAARADGFDAGAIAREARRSGTPVVALVDALRNSVGAADPDAAAYVHWGATSQDIADTAFVLLLRDALPLLAGDHQRLAGTLRRLSDEHAGTVMLGRTLLQPATPITFGLKAAAWHAALARAWRRVAAAWEHAMVLQFGGASGTLAALGARALDVRRRLAAELQLREAPPWHTDRDRLGALAAACGLYAAALGKIARDVALLMQAEVGEVAEAGGGSSTMPHKRNPAGSVVTLAAAGRMPGLVAAFLAGMLQEHERAAGGSQAEWPTLAAIVQGTGVAVASLADAVAGLAVDAPRMRANLDATRGAVLAEHAVMLLAPRVGRGRAQEMVGRALARCRAGETTFGSAVRSMPEAARVLAPAEMHALDGADTYVGSAEALRRELLADEAGHEDMHGPRARGGPS